LTSLNISSFSSTFEDVVESNVEHVQHFVVVVLEAHFHITSSELAQMTVCERLLRAKDGADLEYAVQISHKGHLLIKLRRLGEVGFVSEVIRELEHIGPTFRSSWDKLGRVDLGEAVLGENLTEEHTDAGLDTEDT